MEAMKNNTNPDIERLKKMGNKPFMYRGRNITVTGYDLPGGNKVEIQTGNGHPVTCFMGALGDKLDEFLTVEDQLSTTERTTALSAYEKERSQMATLEEKLMGQIEKLDENPEYIDQAKEINNTAKNLIKLNGQKVEMLREIRKVKES